MVGYCDLQREFCSDSLHLRALGSECNHETSSVYKLLGQQTFRTIWSEISIGLGPRGGGGAGGGGT